MKTPGVYIQELDAFGNSVVPVATAVPAFIGYTQKTSFNGKSLVNKAIKVTSLAEFLLIFGDTPPEVKYKMDSKPLPDQLVALNARLAITSKNLTDANSAYVAAGGTAVTAAKAADAETALAAAQKALAANKDGTKTNLLTLAVAANQALVVNLTVTEEIATVNTDPNLTALAKAQAELAAAKKAADSAQIAAAQTEVKTAMAAFDVMRDAASFVSGGRAYTLSKETINYRMYSGLKYFYENGGANCYIMTIGAYDYDKESISDTTAFTNAITLLEKESEPTMLVIPDLVEIEDTSEQDLADRYANAYALQQAMINHCGTMLNRVAILDIPGGYSEPMVGTKSFEQFRDSVIPQVPKFTSYAAAYYPWLHTTVYQSSEVSYKNVSEASRGLISELLTNEFTDPKKGLDPKIKIQIDLFTNATSSSDALDAANVIFQNLSKSYQLLMGSIMTDMNLIAPSSAMAGVYTAVDNNEGVWVAPANVGMQSTISPSIKIDHAGQEDLNMPLDGKSICAIRAFTGRGNLVWGARTLDGNSNDWRYVNVRRTLIYIEQSIQEATKAYVFAPNDPSTWVNVKSMIDSFLTGLWKQGGLVGPKPVDAFSVSVGLGSTMTGDDILNGIMRVAIKVAVSRPAEFIELTFQQQMQKG